MASQRPCVLYPLLIIAFVISLCQTTAVKRKSKYPYYRPNYNTNLVFKPFIDALNNNNIQDMHTLHNSISESMHLNPFNSYHNYTQFMREIQILEKLSESTISPFFSILSIAKESQSLDGNALHRIVLTDKSVPSDSKTQILMIFGEHPREFIVSESFLDLLSNTLLSYIDPDDDAMSDILRQFEIDIIPILNPDGKIELERSNNYCWRWNSPQHRVDINRNFDWKFAGKRGSTHRKGTEEWHGISAFSEAESKFVHTLLNHKTYDVVLDIHSGTQQIFVPFVDTESRQIHRIRPQTNEELNLVDYIVSNSNGWFKDSGIAWKYNDYGADGTILDFVGGVANVNYSLCVEVYGDPTVDNSIDCFVQFNPNNGQQFIESLKSIRSLYDGVFDYFRNKKMIEKDLSSRITQSARKLKTSLLQKITKTHDDMLDN